MRSIAKICIGLIFLCLLDSCKDEKVKVVEIPASLQHYLDDFVFEGQERGIEVVIDDLIIRFEEDLEVDGNPAAGLCRTQGNKTPIILLDTTSTNWTLNESSREQLVFHELGHCYLDRQHIDSRMPNGNFRTIMRPSGEQLYGPDLNAFKRNFYLQELFKPETARPSWADLTAYSAQAGLQRTTLINEDFSDNSNNWPIGNGANVQRSIQDGRYTIKSLTSDFTIISPKDFFLPDGNFEIEVDIIFQNETSFASVFWGGHSLDSLDYNFVYLTAESVALIGTLENGIEATLEDFINNNADSYTLTIRHIDQFYYLYLDEIQIDVLQYKALNGGSGGLGVGPGAHVQFDNLRINRLD